VKITALREHICFCCEGTIKKGELCFVFIVNPEKPEKSEFDVIYTCLRCSGEEACKVKIKQKNVTA